MKFVLTLLPLVENTLPLVPTWNLWLQILVQLRVLCQVQLVILHLLQGGTFSSLELNKAQSHSIIFFTIYIVYKK